MIRVFTLVSGLIWIVAQPGLAPAQEQRKGEERPKDSDALYRKEIELLKKEIELLKQELEAVKKENAALRKGEKGADAPAKKSEDSVTKVTVGNVEYEYAGTTRSGPVLTVTVLARSKEGTAVPLRGPMTLIDEEGEKYVGHVPAKFGTAAPTTKLLEGVPTKLHWTFGDRPMNFGDNSPAPPAKVKRFVAVTIDDSFGGNGESIEFRNVPVGVVKPKPNK